MNKINTIKDFYKKGLISEEKFRAEMAKNGVVLPIKDSRFNPTPKKEIGVVVTDNPMNKEEEAIMQKMPAHMRNNVSDGGVQVTIVEKASGFQGMDFTVPSGVDPATVEESYKKLKVMEEQAAARSNKVLQDALKATSKIGRVEPDSRRDSGSNSLQFLRDRGFKV